MRVGIISVFVDFHRRGAHHRGALQPQIGPLIASLLPPHEDVEVVNDTWRDPDWQKDYDLLFISCLHADFDRARQISHYWRRRGAKTVLCGTLASTYSNLCRPYFDAIVIGDPESAVPRIYEDFSKGELQPVYLGSPYDPARLPAPRFELAAQQQLLPISLEVTRGCPFMCEFCALTGIGTRHQVRPTDTVVRDIRQAQRVLRGLVPNYKLKMAAFNDNNIGGNLSYLQELCAALEPLKISWGSAITFNAISNLQIVKMLSRSGCRFLFMGLESFNPEAIADMNKFQNALDKTKMVMDECHKHGILVESGLMLNPMVDDWKYIQSVPQSLHECGLHVPSFICFESPIPGTPHFHRLAAQETPALMPNALLRDFTGYTLVTRPVRENADDFVAAYRWLLQKVYSPVGRLRKLADDLPKFLSHGHLLTGLVDLIIQGPTREKAEAKRTYMAGALQPRTYLAGTDAPPPEASSIPFESGDFEFEEERRLILEPWRVTDSEGRVLDEWRQSTKVFGPKGRISPDAKQLVPITAATVD